MNLQMAKDKNKKQPPEPKKPPEKIIDAKRLFYVRTLDQITQNCLTLGASIGTELRPELSRISPAMYKIADLLGEFRDDVINQFTAKDAKLVKAIDKDKVNNDR